MLQSSAVFMGDSFPFIEYQNLLLLRDICGNSSYLYLNVVHFSTPVIITHLWQLKTTSCFPALVSNMCCSIVQGMGCKKILMSG